MMCAETECNLLWRNCIKLQSHDVDETVYMYVCDVGETVYVCTYVQCNYLDTIWHLYCETRVPVMAASNLKYNSSPLTCLQQFRSC